MLEYKVVDGKDKDVDLLTSIKLVTMIDDEMDKNLSYNEKNKVKKTITSNIELTCTQYKVIYVDKKIAGAYLVLPYEDGNIIDEIFLFPEYRDNGIGTRIINKLKDEEKSLYIWVYKNNIDAIRLFTKLGFVTISNGRTMIMKYDAVYEILNDKMSDISLGYRDKNGSFYSGFNSKFRENYYLQNPKQLLESKLGLCFDQVELARELASKVDAATRTYFILYPDDDMDYSHAIFVYKDKKRYYWYENSWIKYKGLHIYDSKDELLEDVLGKFVNTIPNGNMKKVKMYAYDKPRFGSNYIRFMSFCISNRNIKVK